MPCKLSVLVVAPWELGEATEFPPGHLPCQFAMLEKTVFVLEGGGCDAVLSPAQTGSRGTAAVFQ